MFVPENWIIADVKALEFDAPVQLFIHCLEDTEVILFDKNCMFKADLSKAEIVQNA